MTSQCRLSYKFCPVRKIPTAGAPSGWNLTPPAWGCLNDLSSDEHSDYRALRLHVRPDCNHITSIQCSITAPSDP
jgi:hypothetical protein